MKARLHPLSMFTGAGCAALVFVAMGHAARPASQAGNYRIVEDVTATEAKDLAERGYEYVGYLGQSTKGERIDETLWRQNVTK